MNLEPGDSVLYMKVGTHAQESLTDILSRKREEISAAGFAMWGYGGNTCHPLKAVQPFAAGQRKPIILYMQPMQSRHHAQPERAREYSIDGHRWTAISPEINVLGSKYALCIGSLEEVTETLNLADTRVALGRSKGVSGDKYIRGRVDKACLEIVSSGQPGNKPVEIKLAAEIVSPYAVMLRN